MSGMPLFSALVFLTAIIILIFATQRHVHPFVAIVVVATAFGLAVGFSISFIGKTFGSGFSEMIYSPGLVIVGAGLIAGLAENTAASDRLMTAIEHWRWLGSTRLAALLGLIAGIGASPAAAYAVLTPLFRPIGGTTEQGRATVTVALALAISASHGLVLFSPVPIAAAAILDAGWSRVALFGLPLTLVLIAFGAVFARWLPSVAVASQPVTNEPSPAAEKRSGSAIVLLVATAIPLLMLMVQSLGDIPSEPLGGGSSRELVLGVGRPLFLFLAGVGIMVAGHWRQGSKLLADATWTGRILGDVSGILLVVCAAGGLQRLCQETGMAELLGEYLLGWQGLFGNFGGVLVPFLIAAVIKTLQGSSLVAAITAAGMVQPIVASLGLGDPNGKALAALAVGIGAMTMSHVNDEYFWLVANRAGLTPLRGLISITTGTLLQGVVAAVALVILAALVHGI
jgi:gluconate:H+ symporter, GntP family